MILYCTLLENYSRYSNRITFDLPIVCILHISLTLRFLAYHLSTEHPIHIQLGTTEEMEPDVYSIETTPSKQVPMILKNRKIIFYKSELSHVLTTFF